MNTAIYGIPIAAAAALAAFGFCLGTKKEPVRQDHSAVLVELFTSEGCSSCPPADKLLSKLKGDGGGIIALEEHVDYWNNLGWKDPYSSPAFSDRQGRYSQNLGVDGVYTPQMVVDGETQFVGSDEGQARSSIDRASQPAKASIRLSLADSSLKVQISNVPRASQVWYAVTEDGLSSSVARGENSGRVLPHTSVVRELSEVGAVQTGGSFSKEIPVRLDRAWNPRKVRLVVFTQVPGQGRVTGASEVSVG